MDELQDLKIMLPCESGWFAEMVWDQNPLLYQLVFIGSLIDLLSLPFFALRYKLWARTPNLKRISNPTPDPSPNS
jgi:hypothetical protein